MKNILILLFSFILCIIGVIYFIQGIYDLPPLDPGETEYSPEDLEKINIGASLNIIGLAIFFVKLAIMQAPNKG